MQWLGGGSHLGVPCMGALLGRVEREGGKQVRINIQEARENQVSLKLSPLQGMKAQPLQSIFLGEVTHASYQTCSSLIFGFALDG